MLNILKPKEKLPRWQAMYMEVKSSIEKIISKSTGDMWLLATAILNSMKEMEARYNLGSDGEYVNARWIYANYKFSRAAMYYHTKHNHLPHMTVDGERVFAHETWEKFASKYGIEKNDQADG